jgi:hypothetical protein
MGAVVLCGSFAAKAASINFSTALAAGNLAQSVTTGGITISGWDVSKANGTLWSNGVILNNRREAPDDLGLGVCSLPSNCPTTGNGDNNEIDNNGTKFEVIRLDFGSSTLVTSIGLGSLDGGLKDGFAIFGSNTALPNLSMLTALVQGTNQSAGSVDPVLSINQSFRYFFVAPKDRGAYSSDSDFLLRSVSTGVTPSSVPEPVTCGMLGVGLVGLVALRGVRTLACRVETSLQHARVRTPQLFCDCCYRLPRDLDGDWRILRKWKLDGDRQTRICIPRLQPALV